MRSEHLFLVLLTAAGCVKAPEIGNADCFNRADCLGGEVCEANRCVVAGEPGDAAVDVLDLSDVPDVNQGDAEVVADATPDAGPAPDAEADTGPAPDAAPDAFMPPPETCIVGAATQVYESVADAAPFFNVAPKGDGEWGIAWTEWSAPEAPYGFQCFHLDDPDSQYEAHPLGAVPLNYGTALQAPSIVWNGGGYTVAFPDDLDPEAHNHPALRLRKISGGNCDTLSEPTDVMFPELGVQSTQLMHDGTAHMLVWEGGDPDIALNTYFNRFDALDELGPEDEPRIRMMPDAGKPQAIWISNPGRMAIAFEKWREVNHSVDLVARAGDAEGVTDRNGELVIAADPEAEEGPIAITEAAHNPAVAFVRGPDEGPYELLFAPLAFEGAGISAAGEPREVGFLDPEFPGVDIAYDPDNRVYAVSWIFVDRAVEPRETLLKIYIFDKDGLIVREPIHLQTPEGRDVSSPRVVWGGEGRGFSVFWSEQGNRGGIFHAPLRCPSAPE